MGVFDDLIKIDENGDVSYEGWIEWKHIPTGLIHCPICLVLDKCWFNNILKPELPQHENCHCMVNNISRPIPNINSNAKCDLKKFTDYIFSDKYAWNGKRDLFEMLGFYNKRFSVFKRRIWNPSSKKVYYKLGKLDMQGQRIGIDIKFIKNGRNLVFTSGWMVRPKGVITNNTPLAD